MKVLVLLSSLGRLSHNGHHIDMAIDEIEKGNEVYFLGCDKSVGMCMSNPGKNPLICNVCKHFTKAEQDRLAPKDSKLIWIGDYIDKDFVDKLEPLAYSAAAELRALKYKGVDVGLGVMSSYISLTRNLTPKITTESRKYFDALIKSEMVTVNALENLQKEYGFELYIFQNGRGAQVKPFLNFCQQNEIDFWCTEDYANSPIHNSMDNYWNTTPHSITAMNEKCMRAWDTSDEPLEKKDEIGRSFFEKRKNAKPAMDKIYTIDQVSGLLPEGWNTEVENIVIFNSSEDEFCAVSKEYDDAAVFQSQLDGIKAIVEHYEGDKTKHFTLRVHPNLKDIKYKYHTDLYKLNYPNLTVIPCNSPVSTYALMDAADKVVVFGSTTGVEASYWGKPVICLAGAAYLPMNVVHKPDTVDELWGMLDDKELNCMNNSDVIKYGYYIFHKPEDDTKHIDIGISWFRFFNKKCACFNYQKCLGSKYMYAVLSAGLYTLKYCWPSTFKRLPLEEE